MTKEAIQWFKTTFPAGTKVMVDYMEKDPMPIAQGSVGEVQFVDDVGTVHCKFYDGRTLGLLPDVDLFHRVT